MYAILSNGNLLALCDKPRYIKVNPESGAFVEADKDNAEGVAVNGTAYNLPGSTTIQGAQEAVVAEKEGAEYIFQNRAHIIQVEQTTGVAIVGVEEALCEMDATQEARVSAMEEALCELDSAVNGEVK